MRFLADMGISPETVRWLRSLGHEATHIADERLHRASDGDILIKARDEDSIVLTHDLDFGARIAASRAILPSIIIFRLSNMRPENVNAHLAIVLERHANNLEEGAVLAVSERRIRVRRLPI
jgi:predicted nuclease of predicted toxin-antitoxin system